MNLDNFWKELRRRRVVRVVAAYAVAVFIILQVASLTFEPLGLPDWTYKFVLILCMAGFPVVAALAWAFDVKKDNGSDKIKTGRSLRVTRPVMLGSIALLGVGFALWNFSTNPTEVEADGVDVDLMAVVPFRISSADDRVTILREGVLDMLAPIFSGTPQIIDSGRMINAWRDFAGDSEADLSEAESVELARRLGAGRVLVGSVVGDGESFAMNARLLRVPGGDLIGDVSIDGSAPRLRETLTQLASQVLSMEAGVDEGQIDYLTELPLDALTAYLDGRNAYRRTSYVESRTAHMKALDIDSTFALAAVGAYQAIQMGLDAERFTLRNRALRLLRNHIDNLPPRDQEFVRLWLPPDTRYSVVERVGRLGELVNRFPESPEAWYEYGDIMFHNMWRVSQDDWSERSKEAFEKALDLDPLMEITKQHLDYHQAMSPDTVGLRDMLENRIRIAEGSETEVWARSSMASMLGDSANLAWINDNIERLPYTQVQMLIINEGFIPFGFSYPSPYMDRIFARTERSALTRTDRMQYMTMKHGYLRSAGRSDDADSVLKDFEDEFYPIPSQWIEANLYWDGPADPANSAIPVLQASISGQGSLTWADGASACILEVWKMKQGDLSTVGLTIERLRNGSDDPDPLHGRNAYCALALETIAAHRRNESRSTVLVEELTRTMDQGAAGAPYWSKFELARILEERGDPAKAAKILKYVGGTDPFPLGMSTILREAGRLNELAGNLTEALNDYRGFQRIRPNPDSRFEAMSESIDQKIAELEAVLEN
ncbi:MAG: hypothetical protein ACJ0RV_01405 [Longimicrobiales bacterium]